MLNFCHCNWGGGDVATGLNTTASNSACRDVLLKPGWLKTSFCTLKFKSRLLVESYLGQVVRHRMLFNLESLKFNFGTKNLLWGKGPNSRVYNGIIITASWSAPDDIATGKVLLMMLLSISVKLTKDVALSSTATGVNWPLLVNSCCPFKSCAHQKNCEMGV